MAIDLQRLQLNVNLLSLQPGFKNQELQYIIATDDQNFRLADWRDEPGEGETKFYCFLLQKDLFLPQGNIVLKQSYVVSEQPMYPVIQTAEDFITMIRSIEECHACKGIRQFEVNAVDAIVSELRNTFDNVQKHLVQSDEAQHLVLVIRDVETSISANMVYFRQKAPFSEVHYEHVSEEGIDNG
jgi:hypothetical protein